MCSPLAQRASEVLLADLFTAACAPEETSGESAVLCETCGIRTGHVKQSCETVPPNVLLMYINSVAGVAANDSEILTPVLVDEQVTFHSLGQMDLCGAVYHRGDRPDKGHYYCAARGKAGGRCVVFNDDAPPMPINCGSAQVYPREVTAGVDAADSAHPPPSRKRLKRVRGETAGGVRPGD